MFVAVTCDEVTTVDNQLWISTHTYVITNFYREPIPIWLEQLMDDSSASRLALIIVIALQVHRGLSTKDVKKKFISFGASKVVVFHVAICHGFSFWSSCS